MSIIRKEPSKSKRKKNKSKKRDIWRARKRQEIFGLLNQDKIQIKAEELLLSTKFMSSIPLSNKLMPKVTNQEKTSKNLKILQIKKLFKSQNKKILLLFSYILTVHFFTTTESLISDITWWLLIFLALRGLIGTSKATFVHHLMSLTSIHFSLKFTWQMMLFKRTSLITINMRHITRFHMSNFKGILTRTTVEKSIILKNRFYL